jgi:predicted XRE-type DNA-binding protein
MSKAKTKTFSSVWDAIADTPHEAENLRVRSELMSKIALILERSDWTQADTARRCGVTQPRINDLLRGRISRFSLDALVNIACMLGQHVRLELGAIRTKGAARRTRPLNRRSARAVAARPVRARGKPGGALANPKLGR